MQATRYWLPRGLGLLSFLWFTLMAAPGFYWLDSAELSAGGIGLGSAHPSGFPLYMLLVKAASLAPIGELAFRVNLLSAACGALAVGGVARLVLIVGRDDWATVAGAVGAAGVLGFSLLFARQATVAEIYAPTAALIVLTLSLFERVASGGNASVGLSLAWVAGLGFAVHPEYRLLMGMPILALLSLRAYRGARWPLLAPVMTVFAAAATYLYLPVRSATGRIASLDWGHPDTFHRAWAHASGAEVRKAFDDRMMSTAGELVTNDVSTFAEQILDHMGALAVLAGLVGLVLLLVERRTRWLGVAVGTIVLLDFLYASWINPMGLVDWQNGVPMVLALSVCAGAAIAVLARSAGSGAPFVGAVIALIMMMPPALASVPALALVGDLPRDFGEAALLSAPPEAILLSQGDSLSAGASFLQSIEGARPDVAALVVPMLSDRKRVAHLMQMTSKENSEVPADSDWSLQGLWASGRPLIWEPGPVGVPQGGGLVHGPVVARLVKASQGQPPGSDVLARMSTLYKGRGARDPSARRALAASLINLGRSAVHYEKAEMARQLFEAALEVRPGNAVALVNLGVLYSRAGELERAVEVTEQALSHEPNRPRALVNAARYHLALGQLDKAAAHAERALRVAPKSASSWTMAGLVDMKAGSRDRARRRLEKALVLSPDHAEARDALKALEAGR